MKQKHQTRPLAAGPKCIWKWRWDKYHTSNLWPGTKGKLEISLSSFPHLSPMQLFLTITLWPSSLKRGLKWKAKSWPAFRSTVILKNRNRRPSSNSHPTIFNMIFNDIRPTFPWPPKPQSHHLLLGIGVDSSNNGDQHFVMNSILKLMIVRDTLCTKNKRKLFSFLYVSVCVCVMSVCLCVTLTRLLWGADGGAGVGPGAGLGQPPPDVGWGEGQEGWVGCPPGHVGPPADGCPGHVGLGWGWPVGKHMQKLMWQYFSHVTLTLE